MMRVNLHIGPDNIFHISSKKKVISQEHKNLFKVFFLIRCISYSSSIQRSCSLSKDLLESREKVKNPFLMIINENFEVLGFKLT